MGLALTHSYSIPRNLSAVLCYLGQAASTFDGLRTAIPPAFKEHITHIFSHTRFSKSKDSSVSPNKHCTTSFLTGHTTVEPAKHVNCRAYPTAHNTTILNAMDHASGVPEITAPSYGSLYTTALAEKLIRVGTTKEPLMDPEGEDDITDEQEECLGNLTRTVYDYLVTNVDCSEFECGLVPRQLQRLRRHRRRRRLTQYDSNDPIGSKNEHGQCYANIQSPRIPNDADVNRRYISPDDGTRSAKGTTVRRIRHQAEPHRHWLGGTHFIERLIFDRGVLFPRPVDAQGRPFYKGMDYLIAALNGAGIGSDEVVGKLDGLAARLDQALEQQVEVVKWDPEVMDKRQRVFGSFGVVLEDGIPSQD